LTILSLSLSLSLSLNKQLWTKHRNQWTIHKNENNIEYETKNTPEIVQQYIDQGLQFKLNDFENHLDDILKDWTNQKLLPSLKQQPQQC
jgi:hypothetical protein